MGGCIPNTEEADIKALINAINIATMGTVSDVSDSELKAIMEGEEVILTSSTFRVMIATSRVKPPGKQRKRNSFLVCITSLYCASYMDAAMRVSALQGSLSSTKNNGVLKQDVVDFRVCISNGYVDHATSIGYEVSFHVLRGKVNDVRTIASNGNVTETGEGRSV